MRKAIAVAAVVIWSVCLMAQTNQQVSQPEIPKTCTEQNLLRDNKGNIVWFTHEQMKVRATKIVKPRAPAGLSSRARIDAEVLLGLLVGADGKPSCIWLVSGHPMVVPSALEAARRWEFKPALVKGKPVAFAGMLRFKVRDYQFTY